MVEPRLLNLTEHKQDRREINNTNTSAMHNHDEMVILCIEMVLGMSHKLNGTPKTNIAINGLKLHL